MPPVIYTVTATLKTVDWIIIALYFVFSLLIGLYFTRRATKSTREYFTSGQGVSWWLLGTSMVATTFAADTPLAVSGLVMKQGIAGNWYWWCGIPMGILGVFFFSRLWRRADLVTDVEFISRRYSGKPASALRGFNAVYGGIITNSVTIGWVNLAMANILSMTFHFDKFKAVLLCFFLTMCYSALSGLWGVLVTDFFQFALATGMAIILAFYAVSHTGGMNSVLEKLSSLYGENAAAMTAIIPSNHVAAPLYNEPLAPFSLFLVYALVAWWSNGVGGGGYLAQRIFSAKNEKHAFLGYLWFIVANYCLRPWPWIVVGLVAAVMFPGIADPATGQHNPELGYVAVMLKLLPAGLLGLMLASFFAAYMSTISTQLNWGASYLVNDLYRPFIRPKAGEKHYVAVSVIATVFIALCGAVVTFLLDNIFTAWLFLSALAAGGGIVSILRWYWWRINAWTEISAAIASFGTFGALYLFVPAMSRFPMILFISVPVASLVWLIVTFLTKPTDESTLVAFYRKVHPGGPGWKKIADKIKEPLEAVPLFRAVNLVSALLGIVAVYGALFGIGHVILQRTTLGCVELIVAAVCGLLMVRNLSGEKWAD